MASFGPERLQSRRRAFFFSGLPRGSSHPPTVDGCSCSSQKQPQEASEFIRMEECGQPLSSNLFVVPDERRVSFQPLCQGTPMSTKSFIISLPIITGDQDRRRLRKSFSFGCNLQNAVMGGGWDRVLIHGQLPFCKGWVSLLGYSFPLRARKPKRAPSFNSVAKPHSENVTRWSEAPASRVGARIG